MAKDKNTIVLQLEVDESSRKKLLDGLNGVLTDTDKKFDIMKSSLVAFNDVFATTTGYAERLSLALTGTVKQLQLVGQIARAVAPSELKGDSAESGAKVTQAASAALSNMSQEAEAAQDSLSGVALELMEIRKKAVEAAEGANTVTQGYGNARKVFRQLAETAQTAYSLISQYQEGEGQNLASEVRMREETVKRTRSMVKEVKAMHSAQILNNDEAEKLYKNILTIERGLKRGMSEASISATAELARMSRSGVSSLKALANTGIEDLKIGFRSGTVSAQQFEQQLESSMTAIKANMEQLGAQDIDLSNLKNQWNSAMLWMQNSSNAAGKKSASEIARGFNDELKTVGQKLAVHEVSAESAQSFATDIYEKYMGAIDASGIEDAVADSLEEKFRIALKQFSGNIEKFAAKSIADTAANITRRFKTEMQTELDTIDVELVNPQDRRTTFGAAEKKAAALERRREQEQTRLLQKTQELQRTRLADGQNVQKVMLLESEREAIANNLLAIEKQKLMIAREVEEVSKLIVTQEIRSYRMNGETADQRMLLLTNLEQVEEALRRIEREGIDVADVITKLQSRVYSAGQSQASAASRRGLRKNAFMSGEPFTYDTYLQLSRVAQDSMMFANDFNMGLMSIANNLDMLFMAFSQLKSEAGGAALGIKALFKGIGSGMGAIMILNMATSLLYATGALGKLGDKMTVFMDKLRGITPEMKAYKEAYDEAFTKAPEFDRQNIAYLENVSDSMERLRDRAQEAIDKLGAMRSTAKTLGNEGGLQFSPIPAGQLKTKIEEYDELISEAERIRDRYQTGLSEAQRKIAEREAVMLSDLLDSSAGVQTTFSRDMEALVKGHEAEMLELQASSGDDSIELQKKIAQAKAEIRAKELREELAAQGLLIADYRAAAAKITSASYRSSATTALNRMTSEFFDAAEATESLIARLFENVEVPVKKTGDSVEDIVREIESLGDEARLASAKVLQETQAQRLNALQIEMENRGKELSRQLEEFRDKEGVTQDQILQYERHIGTLRSVASQEFQEERLRVIHEFASKEITEIRAVFDAHVSSMEQRKQMEDDMHKMRMSLLPRERSEMAEIVESYTSQIQQLRQRVVQTVLDVQDEYVESSLKLGKLTQDDADNLVNSVRQQLERISNLQDFSESSIAEQFGFSPALMQALEERLKGVSKYMDMIRNTAVLKTMEAARAQRDADEKLRDEYRSMAASAGFDLMMAEAETIKNLEDRNLKIRKLNHERTVDEINHQYEIEKLRISEITSEYERTKALIALNQWKNDKLKEANVDFRLSEEADELALETQRKQHLENLKQQLQQTVGSIAEIAAASFTAWEQSRRDDLRSTGMAERDINKVLEQEGKKRFEMMKNLAAAEAAISAIASAQHAYEGVMAASKFLGPAALPLAAAAAGIALAAGYARVKAIQSQSMSSANPASGGSGGQSSGGGYSATASVGSSFSGRVFGADIQRETAQSISFGPLADVIMELPARIASETAKLDRPPSVLEISRRDAGEVVRVGGDYIRRSTR